MPKICVVCPTWNNFPFLVRMVESLRDVIQETDWRLVVIDNGSTDQTAGYLRQLKQKGVPLTILSQDENLGFIKATNLGMREAKPGEIICLANDDIQFTDPTTLARLADDLADPKAGMVVPVSDYVMHLQKLDLSWQIPKVKHETGAVVYFCGLWRYETYQEIGGLDERFGIGGCDDLDLSIRLKEAGYKLLIDRTVFVKHYGSATLMRTEGGQEGYVKLDADKRKILIEKWGEQKVAELFRLPDFLLYGPQYYANFGHGGYQRNAFWLAEWKRIATKIVETLHPKNILDAGCAHGMLVEGLMDIGGLSAWGLDISDFAISQARADIQPRLRVGSVVDALSPQDQFDLIACIEVLEHLNAADGEKAVANLCAHTERVLFSSSPNDHTEATHVNVQSPEYWDTLFARHGLSKDSGYDASYLTPWARLYVKKEP